jgi:hypothetical protein
VAQDGRMPAQNPLPGSEQGPVDFHLSHCGLQSASHEKPGDQRGLMRGESLSMRPIRRELRSV